MLRNPAYRAFLFIILASIGFFNPLSILTPAMQKGIFYLSVLWGFIESIRCGVDIKNADYPKVGYALVMGGLTVAIMMSTLMHPQSLSTSMMTSMPIFLAYTTFYIFMKLQVEPKLIIKTFYVLCAISTVVYFCNAASMPNMMFGQQLEAFDENRGIIRIPLVLLEMMPMLVFYAINRFLLDHKRKWLFIIGWLAVPIFLSVVRQVIALTAILGLWFYFRKVSWLRKLTILAVVGVVTLYVLPMIPVYKALIEVSEDQRDDTEENIRVTAWRYYLYENQTNAVTPILGNGMPARGISPWGIQFEAEVKDNGCFAEDVGWAGFYWYFGIFATVGLLIMLIRGITIKKGERRQYLTYTLIFYTVTSVASGPILYYWQIVSLMVVMYLTFGKKETEAVSAPREQDGVIEARRHQYFPQLPARES